MTLPPHSEARAHDVFRRAQRQPHDRRTRFAQRACRHEPLLLARVLQLLHRHARLAGYLEQPLVPPAALDLTMNRRLPELVTGDQLGDFEIEAEHASGGAGVVYRARQGSVHRRLVALKVVVVDDDDPLRARARCTNEARQATACEHPNLAAVYGYGFDDARGLFYLAMQFVPGRAWRETLIDRFGVHRPLRGAQLRELVTQAAQVARALGAIHARGIVHRDVKPLNVLVASAATEAAPPRALLVDFGLARPAQAQGGLTRVLTPEYAAPEVSSGTGLSARSDVYSLGLSLYDLAVGGVPPDAPRPPLSSFGVDPRLSWIVARATDPSSRWRQADGDAFASELEAWLAGGPARHTPAALLYRLVAHPRRARLIGLAVGALFVLVLACFGYRVAAARAALRRGHLRDGIALVAPLPVSVACLWPVDSVGEAAAPGALATVIDTLGRDGSLAAIELALGLLERDGLARHVVLAEFLAVELGRDLVGSSDRPILRLAARFCFERPDLDPATARASVRMRQLLGEFAAGSPSGAGIEHALAALGGCGAPSSLAALAAAAEHAVARGSPAASELGRLAAAAGARILARASTCGLLAELDAVDAATLTKRLWRVAAEETPGRIDTAAEDLLAIWARLQHQRARACDLAAICGERDPPLRARAVARDRLLRRELQTSWPRPIPAVIDASEQRQACADYGWLVGSYGDRAWATALVSRVRAFAPGVGLPEDAAVAAYAEGLAAAEQWHLECLPFAGPDADTRLRKLLEPTSNVRSLAIAVLAADLPDGSAVDQRVGYVDFESRPITVLGARTSIAARGCSHDVDSASPSVHYLRLASPGQSEARWSFAAPQPTGSSLQLEVYAQKGLRPALPYGGEATLDVEFNGRHVHSLAVAGLSDTRFTVIVAPVVGGARHELVLRLAPRSNTTVRVYSLTVTSR